MRTPAGSECPYFYGNYHRGKDIEECRLIGNKPPPNNYTPDLCKTCPIPKYIQANSCPNLQYKAVVNNSILKRWRRVVISATCSKSNLVVKEPQIGCGQCHLLPSFHLGTNHESDNPD
jgi:hypothetical protein